MPTDVIRADFDRIASCASDRDDVLETAAQRLVAEVPLRARVLEIGCGTGHLARELATKRGAKVTAIDVSPGMISVARRRTSSTLGIEYRVADFLSLAPRGFDVVISVNTLHHLALEPAVARMASAVERGGKILIADVFTTAGLAALPYAGISRLVSPGRTASAGCMAAWDAHALRDNIPTFADVRRQLRVALPGVSVRRHLGWRYTAMWQRAS